MAKVKLELSKKNTAEKTALGNKVVTNMTGNTNFLTPNPTLDTLKTATANMATASDDVEAARKIVQVKLSLLYQQESIFDGVITQMGTYVDNVSNGDEASILSSGMDVQKDKSATTLPDKITSVNATSGDSAGEIDLSWDKLYNAKSYVVEIAVNGATLEWKHELISTKSKAELNGLITGTAYQIHVAAVGSAGQGPWSDPVLKVAP
ncbi:MAG: hypothetical protein H6Q17_2831 [Bacteroidetes bacterium]|nr:hypothetical protein [Bacteroidota bacterium]